MVKKSLREIDGIPARNANWIGILVLLPPYDLDQESPMCQPSSPNEAGPVGVRPPSAVARVVAADFPFYYHQLAVACRPHRENGHDPGLRQFETMGSRRCFLGGGDDSRHSNMPKILLLQLLCHEQFVRLSRGRAHGLQ